MYVCKCLYMQKQLKSLEINSNLPVLFTWTNFFFFPFCYFCCGKLLTTNSLQFVWEESVETFKEYTEEIISCIDFVSFHITTVT